MSIVWAGGGAKTLTTIDNIICLFVELVHSSIVFGDPIYNFGFSSLFLYRRRETYVVLYIVKNIIVRFEDTEYTVWEWSWFISVDLHISRFLQHRRRIRTALYSIVLTLAEIICCSNICIVNETKASKENAQIG